MSRIYSITIVTSYQNEWCDITKDVQSLVSESKTEFGVCWLFVPHTTAAITLNEDCDPAVCRDLTTGLEYLVPGSNRFEHAEGNSPAHLKASLIGNSEMVFIEKGQLKFGKWQGVFLAEFDGPRKREVWCRLIAD